MKLLFPFLSSLFFVVFHTAPAHGASCCVSNTSVTNLMILPSKWQQTFGLSQGRVIGDVNAKGSSTFRRSNNREVTNLARLDLAYEWTRNYQSGISLRYQNRSREFNGDSSHSSGWNDVGLSHAYKLNFMNRLWAFQTLNIPSARSQYDANSKFSVDARGTGTYQTSVGIFGIINSKEWDFIYSTEVHRSFARSFDQNQTETEVSGFWGTSFTGGVGYIPWRSKARYGVALTPRFEEAKSVIVNGEKTRGKESLVWDSSLNVSYTLSAAYSLGLNYTDQTLFGPARNTLLSRIIGFQFQTKWE